MIKIIQTTKDSKQRWQSIKPIETGKFSDKKPIFIEVFPNEKFQQILGFGGAFTEAACYNIMTANPQNIEKIMKAYFAKEDLIIPWVV